MGGEWKEWGEGRMERKGRIESGGHGATLAPEVGFKEPCTSTATQGSSLVA